MEREISNILSFIAVSLILVFTYSASFSISRKAAESSSYDGSSSKVCFKSSFNNRLYLGILCTGKIYIYLLQISNTTNHVRQQRLTSNMRLKLILFQKLSK